MAASLGLRSALRIPFAAGWLALLALFASGCSQGAKKAPAPEEFEPPQSAEELLERVVEIYHRADSYQDDGRLTVRYTHNGEVISKTSEFSLAASGPNRLRMRAYDALVACNGRTVRATIDEAPGEVLSVPAPEELSPASIYKHQVLGTALNQIVGSVPMSLFLDPAPLPALLLNGQTPELESPEKIGEHKCYRVRIDRREGALVLWIDEKTYVVRRVEYPADGYRQVLEPYVGPISNMTITADVDDARLNPRIDDAVFELEVPKGAELVDQFDIVRLGTRIPKFKFRALDGRLITRDALADKITVIKFWQKADVFKYYKDLSEFKQVQERFKDQDSVVFLTVSPDLDDVTDEDLQHAFDSAELSLPIARVGRQVAFRCFGLQIVPTTVILGRDSTLQEHVVGIYPNEASALAEKIDTLLAGGDLTLEAPEKPPEYLYFSGFSWKTAEKPQDEPEVEMATAVSKAGIEPRSKPTQLKMKQLWSSKELREPGNILVVPDGGERDRAIVVERLPSVAEIGAGGKVLAKHPLDLPDRPDSAVAFLRTAVDGDGKRYFLGSKAGVQQLHLFDSDWKRLLSYPDAADHPGISDALLADLNGDGQLEMGVGYLQAVGVQCVDLEGGRLWWNRAAESVLSLDVTSPDSHGRRQLLVTGGGFVGTAQGLILPIDAGGRELPQLGLQDVFLRLIFTADLDGNGSAEWCAIGQQWLGPNKPAPNIAVGLSPSGEELWRYPLPAGVHQHIAFRMVASGKLLGGETGQWVIAAPDGSIHILGIDGILIDQFNLGSAPSGMAVANLDGVAALLVANGKTVEALQFEASAPKDAKSK